MALRILATLVVATLLGISGCTNKTQGISIPDNPSTQIPENPGLTDPVNDPGPDPVVPDDPPPPEPVPEPGTILLFGTGLTGIALYRRRRAKKGPSA